MNSSRKDVTEKDKMLYTIWKNNRDFCNRLNRYQLRDDDIIFKTPESSQEDIVFISEVDHMKRPTAGVALVPELLRKPRKSSKIKLKPIIRPRAKKVDEGGGFFDQSSTRFFMEADAIIDQKQIEPLVARSMEADCAAKKVAVGRPARPLLGGCFSHQRLYFPIPPPSLSFSLSSSSSAMAEVTSWRTTASSNSPPTQLKPPERAPLSICFTSSACEPIINAQSQKITSPNKVLSTAATSWQSSAAEPSNDLADASGGSPKAVHIGTPADSSKDPSKEIGKSTADSKPILEVRPKIKKVLRPDLSLARPVGEPTSTADEPTSTADEPTSTADGPTSTADGPTSTADEPVANLSSMNDSNKNMHWAVVDVTQPSSCTKSTVSNRAAGFSGSSIFKSSASGLGCPVKREIVSPTPDSDSAATIEPPVHKSSEPLAVVATLTPKMETSKSAAVAPPKSTPSLTVVRTTIAADVVPLRNPKKELMPYFATTSVAAQLSAPTSSLSLTTSTSGSSAISSSDAPPLSKLPTPNITMKTEAISQNQHPELLSFFSLSSEEDVDLAATKKLSTVAGGVKGELFDRRDDENDSSFSSCASSPRPAAASASIRELNNLLRSAGSLLNVRPTNLSASVSAHLDKTINSVFRSVTAGAHQSPSQTSPTEEIIPPVVEPSPTPAITTAPGHLSIIDEAICSVLERNTAEAAALDARLAVLSALMPSAPPATQDQEWIFDESSGRSSSSPVEKTLNEVAAADISESSSTHSQLLPVKLELSISQETSSIDAVDSPLTADDHDLIRRYEREHRASISATTDTAIVLPSPPILSSENVVGGSSSTSVAIEAPASVDDNSGQKPLRKRIKVETYYLSDSEETQTESSSTFPNIVELGNGIGVYDKRTEDSLKRCWQWGREELKFEVELKMLTSQIAAARESLASLINRQREVLSKRDGIRERIQQEYAKIRHKAS